MLKYKHLWSIFPYSSSYICSRFLASEKFLKWAKRCMLHNRITSKRDCSKLLTWKSHFMLQRRKQGFKVMQAGLIRETIYIVSFYLSLSGSNTELWYAR